MEFPLYCLGQAFGTSSARRITGVETADVAAIVANVIALWHAVSPLNITVRDGVITARETAIACQSVTQRCSHGVAAMTNRMLSAPRISQFFVALHQWLTLGGCVDPHLMQRALSSFIANAVQAMPDGGSLTINATADDGSVAIRVSDTGIGIPADMRDKMFSPLTTGKAKGTGLGLAVVKRIVEAHHGTITFESEEGRGTTFTVKVPQMAD